MAGQLFLHAKDGGFVPCPSEFLDWMETLQPNSYPVPTGLAVPSSALHSSHSVQASLPDSVPPMLAGLSHDKLEQLLTLKDVYKFARECYKAAGKELLLKMTKNTSTEKVCSAIVNGQVIAEAKSPGSLEVNKLASMAALRLLNPLLAEKWIQRH